MVTEFSYLGVDFRTMGPTRTRKQEESVLHETTTKKFTCETLQTKFIKRVLGLKRRAMNWAAKGEIGAESTIAVVLEKTARYVTAIKQTKPDSLVKVALCWY